ncbi:hypothetical protein [Labrenzia sp. PHM005]|uniref:hypothetical protein n=1 Tax=Labrenzia sp. PHM005 TaxID=2590016 RepID=UPI0011408BBD|nr:hypothetical protein [Labrenzia sp. PHM005]QDG74423.1 hypothetical protein FJ695_00225 [Labrenzia sp. PHM005]
MENNYTGVEFPVTKSAMLGLIDAEIEILTERRDKFYRRMLRYRTFSWVSRAGGMFFLTVGVILPLLQVPLHSWLPHFPTVELAYASLLLAGIAILSDQVFVHTDSWMLNASAVTATESIRSELIQYRNILSATVPSDDAAQEKIESCISIIRENRDAADAVKSSVEISFGEKIREGRSVLSKRIAAATPEARKLAREVIHEKMKSSKDKESKNAQLGCLEIEIGNPERLSTAQVSVGGEKHEWDPSRRAMAIGELPVGMVSVGIAAELDDGNSYVTENFIDIRSEAVARKVFTLPHTKS